MYTGNFEVTLVASSIENFKEYGLDTDEILWTATLEEIRSQADISSVVSSEGSIQHHCASTWMLIHCVRSFSPSSVAQELCRSQKNYCNGLPPICLIIISHRVMK